MEYVSKGNTRYEHVGTGGGEEIFHQVSLAKREKISLLRVRREAEPSRYVMTPDQGGIELQQLHGSSFYPPSSLFTLRISLYSSSSSYSSSLSVTL